MSTLQRPLQLPALQLPALQVLALQGITLFTLSLTACSGSDSESPTPEPVGDRRAPFAAVVTSDYSNGTLSLLHLDSDEAELDLLSVGGDTLVEGHADQLYLMKSSFSGPNYLSIHKTDQALSLVKEVALGDGANPRDVAFANGKGYVSLFNANKVQVFDPATGELGAEIAFDDYADPDGDANPLAMDVLGDTLFVGLVRIDYTNNYLPAGPGYVVAIDTKTDTIQYAVETTGKNLSHLYVYDETTLMVASIGNYGEADGGIEAIDLTSKESLGFVFTDETLGVQDKGAFTVSQGVLYMVKEAELVALDPASKEILPTPAGLEDLVLQSVSTDPNGHLWLSDVEKQLWVYDPIQEELLTDTGRTFTRETTQGLYSLGFVLSPTLQE